jgi:uncharacterized membrane protein YdbT with pleckstrin-like domain
MVESVLYEGPVSHKTRFWTYVLCAIVPVLGWLWAIAVYLTVKSVVYKVTTQRVEVTRGLVSKEVESVLLWRVKDVRYQQTVWNRVLGLGTVTLSYLDDVEGDVLSVRGLPDARGLYEQLVKAVDEAARAKRSAAS